MLYTSDNNPNLPKTANFRCIFICRHCKALALLFPPHKNPLKKQIWIYYRQPIVILGTVKIFLQSFLLFLCGFASPPSRRAQHRATRGRRSKNKGGIKNKFSFLRQHFLKGIYTVLFSAGKQYTII